MNKKRGYKHGLSNTGIYVIWKGVMQRCLYPKHKSFHYYGGKGITICNEWKNFRNFKDDMRLLYLKTKLKFPNEKITIERKNNNMGYCIENCTFVPMKNQINNKSNVIPVKAINKITKEVVIARNQTELAKRIGITNTLISRYLNGVIKNNRNGWVIEYHQ